MSRAQWSLREAAERGASVQFIVFGLVVAAVSGLLARAIIHVATRKRHSPPLDRGPTERRAILAAAIVGGPATLFVICWVSGGTVGPEFGEEMMMLGPALAMPASAIIAWLAGEALSGPTSQSWVPMIAAFLAAEAGFVVGMICVGLVGAGLVKIGLGAKAGPPWAALAALAVPFAVGGAVSAWAYIRWRRDVISRGSA